MVWVCWKEEEEGEEEMTEVRSGLIIAFEVLGQALYTVINLVAALCIITR